MINNSGYGKATENLRNTVDLRLATNIKQVSKPSFVSQKILRKKLVVIDKSKDEVLTF